MIPGRGQESRSPLFNIAEGEQVQHFIGAHKRSAYINLMPVAAVLIAALFYGETVTGPHVAGMVFVMSGVLLTTRGSGGTGDHAKK